MLCRTNRHCSALLLGLALTAIATAIVLPAMLEVSAEERRGVVGCAGSAQAAGGELARGEHDAAVVRARHAAVQLELQQRHGLPQRHAGQRRPRHVPHGSSSPLSDCPGATKPADGCAPPLLPPMGGCCPHLFETSGIWLWIRQRVWPARSLVRVQMSRWESLGPKCRKRNPSLHSSQNHNLRVSGLVFY